MPVLSNPLSGPVCCCLVCATSCECDPCTFYRHDHVGDILAGYSLLKDAKADVERLSRLEKKHHLLTKLSNFQVTVTPANKWKFTLLLGRGDNVRQVCRRSFCHAYQIGNTYLDELIAMLKSGASSCIDRVIHHDAAVPANVTSDKEVRAFAKRFGITLTPKQLGNMRLHNSEKSLVAASWMQYYFLLVGDQVCTNE